MPNLTPRGPFESEAEVFAATAGLRDAVRVVDPDDALTAQIRNDWIDARARYITDTLTACGVRDLGTFDARTVRWIAARWDAEEASILCDWLLRAHQAAEGLLHALPPLDDPRRVAGIEPGPRCGATGRTVLMASDVDCPDCIALMRAEGTR